MSDVQLRQGLRIFLSGGGSILDTSTIIQIMETCQSLLDERDVNLFKVHLARSPHSTHHALCGQYLAAEYRTENGRGTMIGPRDKGRLVDTPEEVTCKSCRQTNHFKALTDPDFEENTTTSGVTHYCINPGWSECNKSWSMFSIRPPKGTTNIREVTCKRCMKTQSFLATQELCAQMPPNPPPLPSL